MNSKSTVKKAISLFLCFAVVLAYTIGFINPLVADADSVNVGANPTPAVDIAVTVPSDYPGTFLDFKQELSQKLIEQGMAPGSFRITDTNVSIDTTDLNGWYVYDHYRDDAAYNALKLSAEQQKKQPKRIADNSHTNGSGTIESYFRNNTNTTGNKCKSFDRHIYSYTDSEGKSSMVFAGYGTQALTDYMIYPAASDSRRNFSFDINPAVIDTHTIGSYGFFLNAGINGSNVQGYALIFAAGSNACTLQKINAGVNGSMTGSAVKSLPSMNFGPKNTVRLTVELNRESVTVQYQYYESNGNLSAPVTLLNNQALDKTGFNGFGPLVNYTSHGCASLSIMKYQDLEMSYESSAFDALKNVQYYQGADQKYFINLAGTNNDPGIPEATNPAFADGINRMNENEIFYLSNADDGKILTDPSKSGHEALGTENGFIAGGDNYVESLAQYIYTNYVNGVKFSQQPIKSDLPLANFHMINAATKEQLMTIHLQHLVNTNGTVKVNMVDKSKPATSGASTGAPIQYWNYKVYDPGNNVVYDSGWVDNVNKIADYEFTKNSTSGRWTFELVVKDNKGLESKISQTYITAFLDNKHPFITGENTSKNKATITLTDTGDGIDEDGITFIEDNRGSGVAAYWVTNDKNNVPTDDDWIVLDEVQHSYSFIHDIVNTDPLVVWVKDECGNIGDEVVFQPIHVVVEDRDGNPIDDYYVIDEPIIVLPDPDDEKFHDIYNPNPTDPDDPDNPDDPGEDKEEFSGWVVPGGGGGNPPSKPMTPGTEPDDNDDHTIVIRPSYSTDKANLIYIANGGKIKDNQGEQDSVSFQVTSNASIMTKIDDQSKNFEISRKGYTFKGWKLLNSDQLANANNDAYRNNAANLLPVDEARAACVKNEAGEITRENYYLIAQWEIGNYTLRLDPNGGTAGNVKSFENIKYNTSLNTLNIPINGRGIPTRPGYVFQGWSTNKGSNASSNFKPVSGSATADVPNMPDHDMTIYAVWTADTSKFVVSFDSDGGNKISDQAYPTAATSYNSFLTPMKAGYQFEGWYLVKADGSVEDTATAGGGAIPAALKGKAHTYKAKWSPKDDTKYTVDYYINSGKKNADGKFIYTRVNDKTLNKTYTGTTESVGKVHPEDILDEITVDGRRYWYDAENEQNKFEGEITGSPTMSLKLCYNGYYNMNVTANDETMGSVTPAADQKEGETPTVSWKANPGYHVARVVVDGKIRDDLLFAGEYTLEEGIHADHDIKVVFEKGSGGSQKAIYQISTGIKGCPDGTCEISPTMNVQQGGEVQLDWKIGKNYKLDKVVLDGTELTDLNSTSLVLKGVQADHELVVHVSKKDGTPDLPTIGGMQTEGQCTVTVNKYGGTTSWVSPSSTQCKKGEYYELQWYAGSEDELHEIHVDGKTISTAGRTGSGTKDDPYKLNVKVSGNVVVDVYFKGNKPEDKVPEFRKDADDYIKVTTQIVGGPGTITGGAVLKKDSDYEVEWTAGGGDKDPDSNDYSYYEVVGVEVNGEEVSKEAKNQVLENLTEDAKVVVKVAPVLHDIGLYKYGAGTISFSKTVFHQQNYKGIYAEPQDGYSITKIVVDGVTIMDTQLKQAAPETQADEPADNSEESVQMMSLAETEEGANLVAEPAPQADDAAAEPTEKYEVKVDAKAVNDVNAKTDLNLSESQVTRSRFDMSVEGAISDHVVQVYFTKDPENAKDGEVTPAPKDNEVYLISAKTVGYAGDNNFFKGTGIFEKGTNSVLRWTNPSGYTLTDVEVNNSAAPLDTMMKFDNISGDKDVVVTFKKGDTNKSPIQGDYKTDEFNITTKLVGGPGTITPSMTAMENDSKKIEWSVTPVEDQEYVVKSVTVNGEQRKDLVNLSELTLLVDQDYEVVVTIKKKGSDFIPPVTDIDTDGDGEPDINKDTDGDGIPDVDIDTDGDGKPDVNVDTDGDGKPDINKDTDGDGKPDVDIDTDDDGKPDINKDTDGDGKPDVDIDTDGDGKPDINKDTDGDGKPDVDIDTDGDGKPDINKDTTGDGKPDLDIDTDGDGKPDVNVDTDGDGKPDVNVDTDGDGVPDINIDTDGDGKPDVNIDTDGDGKPDENIKKPEELPGWTDNQGNNGHKDKPGKDSKPNKANKDELPWWIPTTGDQSSLVLWISLMGAALLAVCGLVWTRIRRKSAKENR